MSGHHSFDRLREKMSADRRTANTSAAADMNREYVLAQIRREIVITQVELAGRLNITQPTYAAFERSGNLRIGTLQKIVSALGGILKLQVEIGGKDYPLQLTNTFSPA